MRFWDCRNENEGKYQWASSVVSIELSHGMNDVLLLVRFNSV
jgi:hypothetical protein